MEINNEEEELVDRDKTSKLTMVMSRLNKNADVLASVPWACSEVMDGLIDLSKEFSQRIEKINARNWNMR